MVRKCLTFLLYMLTGFHVTLQIMFIQLRIPKLQYVLPKEALSQLINPFVTIRLRSDTFCCRGRSMQHLQNNNVLNFVLSECQTTQCQWSSGAQDCDKNNLQGTSAASPRTACPHIMPTSKAMQGQTHLAGRCSQKCFSATLLGALRHFTELSYDREV